MIVLSWRAEAKEYVCNVLVRLGALKFGVFKLTSGKISPYYIDLRLIPSHVEAFRKICDIYVRMVEEDIGLDSFDRIAGIPTAGIPFASVIAFRVEKPFLYVREEVKAHGTGRNIEGVLNSGDRVIVIDDLITTGKSILRAASMVEAEGGIVDKALVLMDREEGGRKALAKSGIRLFSLLTIKEASKILYQIGVLDEEHYKTILKQVKQSG
ncbi:orotate phosphoribosyltransferase [Candidatus Bathyarchaeota archaeon]|nr:orotate phosphoribosyltransferase [Candidatus Bathyarchaeota archaeon]